MILNLNDTLLCRFQTTNLLILYGNNIFLQSFCRFLSFYLQGIFYLTWKKRQKQTHWQYVTYLLSSGFNVLSIPGWATSIPIRFQKALGIVYVEWIQQQVLRTSSGMSFVNTQSIGLPTYCRVVTIILKPSINATLTV